MNEKNQRKKIEYNTKYNKENYVNFSLKIKPEFLERAIEALNHNI